jgi:tetratricopeptide (TPR) repeat protein
MQRQVQDYIFLAKLSNYGAGKQYLQLALQLADSIQNVQAVIEAEKILFFHMILREKPAFMLSYLKERPELNNVLANTGPGYLSWMRAEIYMYGNQLDSALRYFKEAEPAFSRGYDLTTQKNFYGEYANCLQGLNDVPGAITYYKKSLELAREASDLNTLQYGALQLRELYGQQDDYKQSLQYSLLYEHYRDSSDQMGKEKDLALLEIQNEERDQQRREELAEKELQRKHNLQYTFMTIVIIIIFLLIIMIGMFRISAFTIRLMGFLSLIFFFEFIILLLDTRIHHLTHGEPWKIWLIKIGIISFLLPLHHFLEHKLIHYLMSRHLLTIRSRLSPRKWFRNRKKKTTT